MADERRLQRLQRVQQRMAWSFSVAVLAMTVGFFAALSADAPFLSRTVGRFIPAASLVAIAIVILFVVSIVVFALLSSRIDDASLED